MTEEETMKKVYRLEEQIDDAYVAEIKKEMSKPPEYKLLGEVEGP